MPLAIGIDLGTTYTVAATIQDGRPVLIPGADGHYLIPSVVAFPPAGEPLVGQPARHRALCQPGQAVASIKRYMGSQHRVCIGGTGASPRREYTPEEISSLILGKAKRQAQHFLGQPVDQAVITVPAYFNDRQRQATRRAGELAGLEVLRIINEPTAAALAYGLHREDNETVLVWDLGGGTFDISILELGEGIFEVRAVSGDTWLGGDDFDQRIVEYLLLEYQRITGQEFPTEASARASLRELAEQAKIGISAEPAVRVLLPSNGPSISGGVAVFLDREVVRSRCVDLLQRMASCAQQALADAGLTPAQVDRVILVGGASRMPMVRDLARKLLGQEPYRYVDPDTVVAAGAAIQAGMLLGAVGKVRLLDVLPLSLGVATQGSLMARIIHRNTALPASSSRVFTTAVDDQTSMDIEVLQGERELAADNIQLGQFQLTGIPPAPRGVAKVEVSFDADVDGIIHVSARELLTDAEVKVKLAATLSLDRQEIDHLTEEARRLSAQDREQRLGIEARLEAQGLIFAVEGMLHRKGGGIHLPDDAPREALQQALADLKAALLENNGGVICAKNRALRQLLKELHQVSNPPSHVGQRS